MIERRPLAAPESGQSQAAGIVQQAQGNLWGSLADAARGLRQRLQPELNERARDRAAEDVIAAAEAREAGRMVPAQRRTVITQQDAVYNEVLRSGIAATALNDFTAKARELEQQYEYDPEGFDKEASKFLDSYTGLQDGDAYLVSEVDREGQKLFADTKARIDGRRRQADLTEAQQALQDRLTFIQGEMATLIEQKGPGAVYESDYIKLQEDAIGVVNSLVDNPAFGWSDERGAEALDGLANQQQELTEIKVMESIYYQPASEGGGTVKAMEYIDTAVNRMQLDQGERIGARSRMQQRLAWLQQMSALEDKEKEDEIKATIEQGKQYAAAYEADLLSRMGRGQKPQMSDIDALASMVRAGWLDSTRMSTYVTAATSTEPKQTDQLTLASLFDYARAPGVTLEDIEQQSLRSMAAANITASDRERVIEAYNDAQDARSKPGMDALEGYFATGFMDIDTASVKSAKVRAESELRAWMRQNPDATTTQVEQKAKALAVESGRRMPRPPMPSIPGYGNPPIVSIQNVDEWAEGAMLAAYDAVEAGQLSTQDYNRVMSIIDEQVAWQKDQARFAQESVINADQ